MKLWSSILLFACLACAGQTPPEASSATSIEVMRIGDLQLSNPSVPRTGLLCTGQLSKEQFDALVRAGYRNFICLRLLSEPGTGWETAHAGALGVQFTRLPIANADAINEANAIELGRILAQTSEPTVLYCKGSSRVGALYGAMLYFVDDSDAQEALQGAREAGLGGLEPRLRVVLEL